MAFDIKEFLAAVVSVVIGAYILNYLGILKHTSPARARGGAGSTGSNVPRNGYNRGTYPVSSIPTNPIMVPRSAAIGAGGTTRIMNNVGPTEPTRANMSRPIGGRPFVL